MRHSSKRHALAILREVVGEKQDTLPKLIGCSYATVVSIETGRLKLSQKLADRISLETGVSAVWLLENNTRAPIIDQAGKPYTIETFRLTRSMATRSLVHPFDTEYVMSAAMTATVRITTVLVQAYQDNCLRLCDYRVLTMCDELEQEFGFYNRMFKLEDGKSPSPIPFQLIEQRAKEALEKLRREKVNQQKKKHRT